MLELRNIVKDYEAGDTAVRALKGVDITFRKSEFVSILGPSGCGKTTLLNIVGGLDRYTCGDLIINGRSTRRFREYDWDAYRNNCVGFVFQNYNLIPHLSVLGNVELALTLSGESKSTRRKKAQAALEKVGLGEQIHKKPNQLSGGQMQRVAIARAIVNNPEIILADEPTGALDSKNSVQIADLLKEISKDRLIIMVTHNDTLAEKYSTRIIKLLDGEKVSDSDPYEPTQEERLQEIKAEREAHNEAFNPEEYAPEVYPDPTTPLVSKHGKDKKKAGKRTAAGSGAPLADETTGESDSVAEGAEKSAPAAAEQVVLDKAALKQKAKAEKKARKEELRRRKKEMKSTSMNFFTALGLSGRNLATKKGRTALVSFAGSIGIIGIALVLSISNGFTKYIDKLQTDTLAGFPIQVTQQTVDIASLTSMVGGSGEKHEEFPTSGKVEIYTKSYTTMLHYNDISDEYISYVKDMNASWSKAIAYTNSVDMFVLRKNRQGKAETINHKTQTYPGLNMGSVSVWQEMLPTAEYMAEQYSVMAGKMPTEKNELAIVIDKNNRISSSVLDALGLHYPTDEKNKLDLEKLIPNTDEPDFLIVANDNLYPDGTYKSYSQKDDLNALYTTEGEAGQKNIPLKIVGVLRINKGIPLEMFNCGIVYTPALTQAVLDMNGGSAIVQKQKEECEKPLREGVRLWDNKTFYEAAGIPETFIEIEESVAAYEAQAGTTLDALIKENPSLSGTPFAANAEQIIEFSQTRNLLKKSIAYYKNRALESFGAASRASSIFIYPKDFESKKKINNYLDDWNKKNPEKKVMYTDASELLASTMGNMVNIISYVLIAFAAVSLIVSSIMIAIITYSSVIERTKEIGVLRSIGARKKDISRVFNAETFLIGFIAGLMGVFIAFLLTFPINAIIGAVIKANGGGSLGIGNLASLSPLHALILVCISIVLTLISGFIPSRIAAKKDPVTALRTE